MDFADKHHLITSIIQNDSLDHLNMSITSYHYLLPIGDEFVKQAMVMVVP